MSVYPPVGPTQEEILARVGSLVGGKYRIRTLVGAGAMGAVYEAVNEMTEAPVAVKLLLQRNTTTEEAERRFLQEAKVAANLHHPNIVQVFDLGRDEDGSWFIVQELLDGDDLEGLLAQRGGRLDLRQTVELLVPVMVALASAHEAGVVHRDLKPSNIFVDRRGKGPVPKLIDFGVSKVVQGTEAAPITQRGATVGTPDFMAPEQALGSDDLGPPVDVWALGCLFYWCLAGHGPFPGPGLAVLSQMQQMDPERLDEAAGVPVDIADVVAGALQRDPSKRYPSIGHFLGALFNAPTLLETGWGRRLIRAHREEAHEPPPARALRFGLRAHRTQIGLGVAAVILSAAAVGIAIWQGGGEEEPPVEEPVPAPGSVEEAACAPWRDALLALREDDGSFRGVPQLPKSGGATGQALAGLGSAKRICGGVSGEDLEVVGDALVRFERRRGYGTRGAGADDLATAWALLGLHALGDEDRVARARRDLSRAEGADGSYGEGSAYVTAIALLALSTTDPPDEEPADRSATETFLVDGVVHEPGGDGESELDAQAPGALPALAYVVLRKSGALERLPTERRALLESATARSVLWACSIGSEGCERDPADASETTVPPSGDNASGIVRLAWLPWGLAAIEGVLASEHLDDATLARLRATKEALERAQVDDVQRVTHSGTSVLAEHLIALAL